MSDKTREEFEAARGPVPAGVFWRPDLGEYDCCPRLFPEYVTGSMDSSEQFQREFRVWIAAKEKYEPKCDRIAELEKLLSVAACPQCDGSGAVCGADRAVCCNRPTDSGECCNNPIPEQTMEPCQFCEERYTLTNNPGRA